MVLVPATMELLGNANWWLPKWLDRILPRISIEAPPDLAPIAPGTPDIEPRSPAPIA
jgi:RND superfamily putative drug exporter